MPPPRRPSRDGPGLAQARGGDDGREQICWGGERGWLTWLFFLEPAGGNGDSLRQREAEGFELDAAWVIATLPRTY